MISRCRTSALAALALILVAVPEVQAGRPGGGATPPPPTYPPARHWQSMSGYQASSATSGRVYMFGGNNASGTAMNDLWYYSVASGWNLLTPASRTQSLYGRQLASLTCGDGQCVVFGGVSTKVYNEAWYFAEPIDTVATVTWSKVSCSKTAPCPSPRYAPLTAFDPTRHYSVNFGGYANSDSNNVSLADTWTLAASRWTRQQPQHSPPDRADGSATFVPGINKVVIFGGGSQPNDRYPKPLCDLWAWTGSDWEEVSSPGGPCLAGASMGWDGSRVVVTGGFNDLAYLTRNTDTWYFSFTSGNAGNWSKASATVCAPLSGARGAYDPASREFVFFGGYAYPDTFDDTLVCP